MDPMGLDEKWEPFGSFVKYDQILQRHVRLYIQCLEPQTTIYKWLFQLDDSKPLHIGNGCFTKHPFINGCLGFQVTAR